METRFLMNPTTGVVMRWNRVIARRKDLIPCPPPWEKQPEVPYVAVPAGPEGVPDFQPLAPDDSLLSKDEGSRLVQEWFGRDVTRVTKRELVDFGQSRGVTLDEGDSKLAMVTAIHSTEQSVIKE